MEPCSLMLAVIISQLGLNMSQLGLNMSQLLTKIVNAGARTVPLNPVECRQLADRAAIIKDLLRRLQALKVIEHPEKLKPIRRLRDTLFQARVLVESCQDSGSAHCFCTGSELTDRLRSVKEDMDLYVVYLSALLQSRILGELTLMAGDRNAIEQDGGQVHTGPSSSHLNRYIRYFSFDSQVTRVGGGSGLTKFTFSQLAHATKNFTLENKIGFGGSSTVYKARLHEELEVAIKRASCEGKIQFGHFETELELIPKLRHKNIVKLLGYCSQKNERILVFEYMPNRSLDSFIYGKRATEAPLNWSQRSRIVEGVAQGALYLHKLCEPRIIHGDLKPGNILLDSDLNPKICDFGISRALKPGSDVDCTATVTGSHGFIAPEYKEGGCFSIKSDVYSFGATLLQIISGKKLPPPPIALSVESRDYGPLNKWAWELWSEGRLMEFIDPSLHDDPQTAEIEMWVQIALLCVQKQPEERPSMWDVLMMIGCEGVILQEPSLPAYY